MFHGAPAVIVISAPAANSQSCGDCTRAGQNLMLSAHARGPRHLLGGGADALAARRRGEAGARRSRPPAPPSRRSRSAIPKASRPAGRGAVRASAGSACRDLRRPGRPHGSDPEAPAVGSGLRRRRPCRGTLAIVSAAHRDARRMPMTTFNDREKAFENKFAHDEEIQFKTFARRNKLLGLWAANLLGKTGAEADELRHGGGARRLPGDRPRGRVPQALRRSRPPRRRDHHPRARWPSCSASPRCR